MVIQKRKVRLQTWSQMGSSSEEMLEKEGASSFDLSRRVEEERR
jgi:hypothetical protein